MNFEKSTFVKDKGPGQPTVFTNDVVSFVACNPHLGQEAHHGGGRCATDCFSLGLVLTNIIKIKELDISLSIQK